MSSDVSLKTLKAIVRFYTVDCHTYEDAGNQVLAVLVVALPALRDGKITLVSGSGVATYCSKDAELAAQHAHDYRELSAEVYKALERGSYYLANDLAGAALFEKEAYQHHSYKYETGERLAVGRAVADVARQLMWSISDARLARLERTWLDDTYLRAIAKEEAGWDKEQSQAVADYDAQVRYQEWGGDYGEPF